MDFLITRIVDSYRGLNGAIDVREIAQDYYSDGSYVTYANMDKNALCQRLSEYLNNERVRAKIEEGMTPLELLRNEGFSIYASQLNDVTSKSDIVSSVVTSVKPEVFKRLKDSKRYGMGMSMYDQIQEIMHLREVLNRLKMENRELAGKKNR